MNNENKIVLIALISVWILLMLFVILYKTNGTKQTQPKSNDISLYDMSLDLYGKGISLYSHGRYEEAKKVLIASVSMNSNLTFANFLLGEIYYKEGKYSKAIKEFEKYTNHPYEKEWVSCAKTNISICKRKIKERTDQGR